MISVQKKEDDVNAPAPKFGTNCKRSVEKNLDILLDESNSVSAT